MPDVLNTTKRKAKKPHTCDYCGEIIEKGEVYDYAKLVYDGKLYEWKTHKACNYVAQALWNYIDPDDCGMSSEDFQEGCQNFCRTFICPHCESFDSEEGNCRELSRQFCIDEIATRLLNNNLRRVKEDGSSYSKWKLIPKSR